jgi:hypothetical protein
VRARRPPGIRLIVLGISKDTSWQVRGFLTHILPSVSTNNRSIDGLAGSYGVPLWHAIGSFGLYADVRNVLLLLVQDLKDFGREAGNVSFADIDRDTPGQGYMTFVRLYFRC